MDTPPKERRSLTAWLASAAVDRNEPSREPSAAAAAVDDEARRCMASVVSGHRCPRPAVVGHDLCAGHIAMDSTTFVRIGTAK